jgi:hypothetical protein
MTEIHCHNCGGFIGDERPVVYDIPREKVRLAVPHSDLCRCPQPVVYAAPPEPLEISRDITPVVST